MKELALAGTRNRPVPNRDWRRHLCGLCFLGQLEAILSDGTAQVKRNRQVIERLGEPIEPTRWIPAGEEDVANDRGEAHWDFEVSGPKGTAHVRARARRFAREWSLPVLEATFKTMTSGAWKPGIAETRRNSAVQGVMAPPRFHAAGAGGGPKFNAPRRVG